MQHFSVVDLPNKYLCVIWCNLEILTQKLKLPRSSMYRLAQKGRRIKEDIKKSGGSIDRTYLAKDH